MSIIRGMSFIFVTEYFCLKNFIYFTNFFFVIYSCKSIILISHPINNSRKNVKKSLKKKLNKENVKKGLSDLRQNSSWMMTKKMIYFIHCVVCTHKSRNKPFSVFLSNTTKNRKEKDLQKISKFFSCVPNKTN